MTFYKTTRRSVMAGALATGAYGLSGARMALADPNWKQFDGTELEVMLTKGPRAEILQKYEQEFTDLTGIKIGSEQIPEQQQRQKAVIELSSGSPSFDVIHLSYHVQKRQFEKAGWLADFTQFLKNSDLTEASLTLDDFSNAGLVYAKNDAGEIHSLPLSVDYWMIYYNKEMFEKKGLSFPTTYDELATTAEKLTDPGAGEYGFVARGLRNANVPVWTNFLLGYGGTMVGEDGQLKTDTPEAVEAAKLYQRLLTKSAPPGVAGFNWSECQSAFLQGKVGMWMDGVGFAPPLEDPTKSRIAGKVGYGVMPKGPAAQVSATFGDGIGVAQASDKREAGYLYCQWAVSKQMGTRLLQSGSGVPFRKSILNDPEVKAGVKLPAEWVDCVVKSSEISQLGLPVIIPVTEFRDTFGTALTTLLSSGDPAALLKDATAQFQPVLDKSEA